MLWKGTASWDFMGFLANDLTSGEVLTSNFEKFKKQLRSFWGSNQQKFKKFEPQPKIPTSCKTKCVYTNNL